MKVVLFCGGLGMRLRDYDENIPKPMVTIGFRPIMWHLMKYYAHFGHREFVLCLGHKAEIIKQYFLDYQECLSNDFVMRRGGEDLELLNSDIHDWQITFADTGLQSSIGERLRRVRGYLEDEEMFLANYTDCLSDMDLSAFLEHFRAQGTVGSFVTVIPNVTQHYVSASQDGLVQKIHDVRDTDLRVNGGFFAFTNRIFDYIREGEELVDGPFQRLIDDRQLSAYRYDGFWKAMDTFKDKQQFDEIVARGPGPWEVWRGGAAPPPPAAR